MVALEQPKITREQRTDELKAMTADHIARLAEQLSLGYTDEFQALLKYYSQLHKYSPLNSILLWCQRRDGTTFASYATWKKMGRQVRKGAKACWVWCPIVGKDKDEQTGQEYQRLVGFRPGPVFPAEDLEGIEDNPLPPLHRPLPDDVGDLFEELAGKVRAAGIAVELKKLSPGMGGYAQRGDRIVLNQGLDSRNRISVLCHELFHTVLHLQRTADHQDVSAKQMEIEADGAAFVLMTMLGLDEGLSADYLVNWQVTADELTASINRIHQGVKLCRGILGLNERSSIDVTSAKGA